MQSLPISNILVLDRQRKEFAPQEMQLLKHSIASKGLLHAPVLRASPEGPRLVAGGRRLKAITELHQEGIPITYNGAPIPEGEIPYIMLENLSDADIAEAELEENIIRSALTWQEEADARLLVHKLRQTANPAQTIAETAKETAAFSGLKPRAEYTKVANALLLDQYRSDPSVVNAKSEREAVRAVLDRVNKVYETKLAKRQNAIKREHTAIFGDSFTELDKLTPEYFTTIICDPPYGIDADTYKGKDHQYDDSSSYALECGKLILEKGFKLLKPQGYLFMFCDIDHYLTLRNYASQQAYSCWRFPLVWWKGEDTSSHAPWGRDGFRRSTELILFAVKGGAQLRKPGGYDVLHFARPGRADRVHAAEKPVSLLAHLLSLTTLPGDAVLDPFAGSGSIVDAASKCQVSATVIEREPKYFEEIEARLVIKSKEPEPDDQ